MTRPNALLKTTIDIASGALMAQGLYIAIYKDNPLFGCLFFVIGGTFAWKSLQRASRDITKEGRSK